MKPNVIKNLIKDEEEAIQAYTNAINEIDDNKILDVLKHILDEEIEHKEELERLLGENKK